MTSRSVRYAMGGLLVVGFLALGCEKTEPPPPPAPKPAVKPTAEKPVAPAPTPKPVASPATPAKPELEAATNEKLGYTIMLPKGTTTQSADQNGGSYMKDTMIITVGPSIPVKTVDDVLRGVNTDQGTVDKKTEGDVMMAIVTKPSSPINVYAGPKGAKFVAHCMAEPTQKDLAVEVCGSIKPFDKKAGDTKAGDTKPADAKAAGTKPAEPKAADKKK